MLQQEVANVEAQSQYVPPNQTIRLDAKTQSQKTALRLLNDDTPIVLLTGSAGTGKSLLTAYRVATLLKGKRTEKVYLTRPAVAVGKTIGLLPGTVDEKLAPYFAQTVAHIEKFLGVGFTKYCLEKKIIEMLPVEYLRGRSFENCVVVCEEAQNLDHSEFEMMFTRLGDGCQMIFTGDEKQNDLRCESGLKTTVRLVERMLQTHPEYLDQEDIDALDSQIGIVKFTPDDVVRSGLTRAFVKMYHNN
jgi:phosphate starvation-inducible PhoH-like protein